MTYFCALQGCDHKESSIRKACVFCLVRIHMKIGDLIWIHLKDLGNSKVRLVELGDFMVRTFDVLIELLSFFQIRLLNLYIQRAKENSDVIT